MLVIASTSPLNYLILIDAVDLLPHLYRRVVLPQTAWDELKHSRARKSAAEQGWIDLAQAFARLLQTNFRVSQELLQQLLNEHTHRKEHAAGREERG